MERQPIPTGAGDEAMRSLRWRGARSTNSANVSIFVYISADNYREDVGNCPESYLKAAHNEFRNIIQPPMATVVSNKLP